MTCCVSTHQGSLIDGQASASVSTQPTPLLPPARSACAGLALGDVRTISRSHAPAWERRRAAPAAKISPPLGQDFRTLERPGLLPRWSVGARWEIYHRQDCPTRLGVEDNTPLRAVPRFASSLRCRVSTQPTPRLPPVLPACADLALSDSESFGIVWRTRRVAFRRAKAP